MGPEQLGRQVLYHYSDFAKNWLSFLLQNISDRKLVGLDFGCGSAPLGFDMLKRGHEVLFLDVIGSFSFGFLQWRVKKHGLTERALFRGAQSGGPYTEKESLDYVVASDVFEHLEDWNRALVNICKSLKPGGVLLTNYMMIEVDDNPEHVNMNRGEFMGATWELGMEPLTNGVFIKRAPVKRG
jgi:SAM-dependent methyltransferase